MGTLSTAGDPPSSYLWDDTATSLLAFFRGPKAPPPSEPLMIKVKSLPLMYTIKVKLLSGCSYDDVSFYMRGQSLCITGFWPLGLRSSGQRAFLNTLSFDVSIDPASLTIAHGFQGFQLTLRKDTPHK
jgi:hypothetical protein